MLMTALKEQTFPYRIPAKRLGSLYPSLHAAFAAHDYLYVARYADKDAELRGCALLMLGNHVGGERILQRANIHTPLTCLYRAYTAWQDNDPATAQRWISEARAMGSNDVRLDRLAALMQQPSFRILFLSNFCEDREHESFKNLNNFDVNIVKPVDTLSTKGQSLLGDQYASDPQLDLVLVDNLSLLPTGVGDLNPPVVVSVHDCEYTYEFLDKVMSEIDLLSVGSTGGKAIELGRAFNRDTTVYFYPIPLRTPTSDHTSITQKFLDTENRTVDILHTGTIVDDFTIGSKNREILSLVRLPEHLSVRDSHGTRFPIEDYWKLLASTRFSITGHQMLQLCIHSHIRCSVKRRVTTSSTTENATPYIFFV